MKFVTFYQKLFAYPPKSLLNVTCAENQASYNYFDFAEFLVQEKDNIENIFNQVMTDKPNGFQKQREIIFSVFNMKEKTQKESNKRESLARDLNGATRDSLENLGLISEFRNNNKNWSWV